MLLKKVTAMDRLTKAAQRATSFEAFYKEVLAHLGTWYKVPLHWTTAHLRVLYDTQHLSK